MKFSKMLILLPISPAILKNSSAALLPAFFFFFFFSLSLSLSPSLDPGLSRLFPPDVGYFELWSHRVFFY
jgi:hypothetical protein